MFSSSSKVRLVLFLMLLVLAGGKFTASPVMADDNAENVDSLLPPDTIVSNDGTVGLSGMVPAGQTTSSSFYGVDGVADETLISQDEAIEGLDGPAPNTVIGPDGRVQVTNTTYYPSRAIAHLYIIFPNGSSGTCTGWFIGPRMVATAGHCVHTGGSSGQWASSITVRPGRNGSVSPYGSATAIQLYSVSGWTSSGNRDYDYAAIKLSSYLGNTVGWFGFRTQSSHTFSGTYTLRGYPGDKPYGTMWTMNGSILGTSQNIYHLFYQIDTYGGQSGSAVYHNYSDNCNPCSVAIHTLGLTSLEPPYGSTHNSGVRITQSVFNNLFTWKGQ